MPDEQYISAQQAADLLGVSRATIIRRAKDGSLRAYRAHTGPKAPWMFLRADVERAPVPYVPERK